MIDLCGKVLSSKCSSHNKCSSQSALLKVLLIKGALLKVLSLNKVLLVKVLSLQKVLPSKFSLFENLWNKSALLSLHQEESTRRHSAPVHSYLANTI